MKKILGATLIVLAAIIAAGTFGSEYISDTAEAVEPRATPEFFQANDLDAAGNSPVTADDPLIVYSIPEYGGIDSLAAGVAPRTWDGRHRVALFNLRTALNRSLCAVGMTLTPSNCEETRISNLRIADETILTKLIHRDLNTNDETASFGSAGKVGSTTVDYTVTGYVCSDGASPPVFSPPTTTNSGLDSNGDPLPAPTGCADGSNMVITTVDVSMPVRVDWKEESRGSFVIGGANVEQPSGDIEAFVTPASGGDVARFATTIQSNHTGELPLYAYNAAGDKTDGTETDPSSPNPDEYDRPSVTDEDEDFLGRSFTYKLAGANEGASESQMAQTARNMELARALTVKTVFADVAEGLPQAQEPQAIISVREGMALPAGEFTLTLTGSDDAPGGEQRDGAGGGDDNAIQPRANGDG